MSAWAQSVTPSVAEAVELALAKAAIATQKADAAAASATAAEAARDAAEALVAPMASAATLEEAFAGERHDRAIAPDVNAEVIAAAARIRWDLLLTPIKSGSSWDSTAQIQSDLNKLAAATGGKIEIPEGDYYIDPVTIMPAANTLDQNCNLTLTARGRGARLIARSPGMPYMIRARGGRLLLDGVSLHDPSDYCDTAVLFDPLVAYDVNFDLRVKSSLISGFNHSFKGVGKAQSWHIDACYLIGFREAAILSSNDGRNSSITGNLIYGFSGGGDGIVYERDTTQPEGVRIANNCTLTPGGRGIKMLAGLSMHVLGNIFDQQYLGALFDGADSPLAFLSILSNWFGPRLGAAMTSCLELGSAIDGFSVAHNHVVAPRTAMRIGAADRGVIDANNLRVNGALATATDSCLEIDVTRGTSVTGNKMLVSGGALAGSLNETSDLTSASYDGNYFGAAIIRRSAKSVYGDNWGDNIGTTTGLKAGLVKDSASFARIVTDGVTRMVFTESGSGVGAFTPNDQPPNYFSLLGGNATMSIERRGDDGLPPTYSNRKRRLAGDGAVQIGDQVARFRALPWDGSAYTTSYEIHYIVSGAPTAGDVPTDIVFRRYRAGVPYEVARFDARGNVSIGPGVLPNNATDGYLYIPSMFGPPSVQAFLIDGRTPIAVDATNADLMMQVGTQWRPVYRRQNLLMNPTFNINQRGVSGEVSLGGGLYGHDGVRMGAGGAAYTFAPSGSSQQLTVTTNSIVLPIDGALIRGGTYVLSHAGTALARVWQGSPSGTFAVVPATGLVVTGLTAGAHVFVEFSAGTVLEPKFEQGELASRFEPRPLDQDLAMCRRYFRRFTGGAAYPLGVVSVQGTSLICELASGLFMRAVPSYIVSFGDADFIAAAPATGSNSWAVGVGGSSWSTKSGTATITLQANQDRALLRITGATFTAVPNQISIGSGAYIDISAEL